MQYFKIQVTADCHSLSYTEVSDFLGKRSRYFRRSVSQRLGKSEARESEVSH